MTDIKTTTVRFPMASFERLSRVLDETRIPMNDVVVMSVDAILDWVDADPGVPPTPGLVEMARAARRQKKLRGEYDAQMERTEREVLAWEADREEVFHLAKAEKAGPDLVAALREVDATFKRRRTLVDEHKREIAAKRRASETMRQDVERLLAEARRNTAAK